MAYITSQGEELLKGSVCIDPDPAGTSGILCACCDTVISCSQFEAHAGRGSRRAPYDNIFTDDGLSLRKVSASCHHAKSLAHCLGPDRLPRNNVFTADGFLLRKVSGLLPSNPSGLHYHPSMV